MYTGLLSRHDDVIKWKNVPRHWHFVRGIHRSPVNSPLKGQWRRALMFSLICARINDWVNNGEAGDLRRHRVHYDVIVMFNATKNNKQNGQQKCVMELTRKTRSYSVQFSLFDTYQHTTFCLFSTLAHHTGYTDNNPEWFTDEVYWVF